KQKRPALEVAASNTRRIGGFVQLWGFRQTLRCIYYTAFTAVCQTFSEYFSTSSGTTCANVRSCSNGIYCLCNHHTVILSSSSPLSSITEYMSFVCIPLRYRLYWSDILFVCTPIAAAHSSLLPCANNRP